MIIECIHFDLDSVLYLPADFLDVTLRLSVKAMVDYGLEATPDEALAELRKIRKVNSNAADHFNRLCQHFNGSRDPLIIAAGVEKYWDCKVSNMMPAPHAHYILGDLVRCYPLTIITNGIPVKQAGKIIRIGLSHYFTRFAPCAGVRARHFYATDDPDRMKPHPYLWQQAQKDMGFSFSRSVMVGDRYWADILGARRLGMITIKVNQGDHGTETIDEVYEKKKAEVGAVFGRPMVDEEVKTLMTPDYAVASLCEVIEVIGRIESRDSAPMPEGV